MLTKYLLLVLNTLSFTWCQYPEDPYSVPHATIEVFRPRGLRVSIPDYPGIRLFAFHGVVNRRLNGLEAGDLSKDVLKKTNGRWVFEDTKLKLNHGDVINYWLFVIKGNLGFRRDDQQYTVTSFYNAPANFIPPGQDFNQKTTSRPPVISQYVPIANLPPPSSCYCPEQQPVLTLPFCVQPLPLPTAQAPQTTSTTEAPTTTTSAPTNPTPIPDIQIWRELLVNLSRENSEYQDMMAVLRENNNLLVTKLQKLGDENLNRLILKGPTSQFDSPLTAVKSILSEKLGILNTSIVKSAAKSGENIIFELNSTDNKLLVLRNAKSKLSNSKFSIMDIEDVSFLNPDTGKVIIDMRGH